MKSLRSKRLKNKWRLGILISICILFLGIIVLKPSEKISANDDENPIILNKFRFDVQAEANVITGQYITSVIYGDNPGYDSSRTNNIVRSNDTITYFFSVNAASKDGQKYEDLKVRVKSEINDAAIPYKQFVSENTITRTSSFEGNDYIQYDNFIISRTGSLTQIKIDIKNYFGIHGFQIKPKFSIAVSGYGDQVVPENQQEWIPFEEDIPEISVSSVENYTAEIKTNHRPSNGLPNELQYGESSGLETFNKLTNTLDDPNGLITTLGIHIHMAPKEGMNVSGVGGEMAGLAYPVIEEGQDNTFRFELDSAIKVADGSSKYEPYEPGERVPEVFRFGYPRGVYLHSAMKGSIDKYASYYAPGNPKWNYLSSIEYTSRHTSYYGEYQSLPVITEDGTGKISVEFPMKKFEYETSQPFNNLSKDIVAGEFYLRLPIDRYQKPKGLNFKFFAADAMTFNGREVMAKNNAKEGNLIYIKLEDEPLPPSWTPSPKLAEGFTFDKNNTADGIYNVSDLITLKPNTYDGRHLVAPETLVKFTKGLFESVSVTGTPSYTILNEETGKGEGWAKAVVRYGVLKKENEGPGAYSPEKLVAYRADHYDWYNTPYEANLMGSITAVNYSTESDRRITSSFNSNSNIYGRPAFTGAYTKDGTRASVATYRSGYKDLEKTKLIESDSSSRDVLGTITGNGEIKKPKTTKDFLYDQDSVFVKSSKLEQAFFLGTTYLSLEEYQKAQPTASFQAKVTSASLGEKKPMTFTAELTPGEHYKPDTASFSGADFEADSLEPEITMVGNKQLLKWTGVLTTDTDLKGELTKIYTINLTYKITQTIEVFDDYFSQYGVKNYKMKVKVDDGIDYQLPELSSSNIVYWGQQDWTINKSSNREFIGLNDTFTYTLLTQVRTTGAQENIKILDVLPKNGEESSQYHGTYQVKHIEKTRDDIIIYYTSNQMIRRSTDPNEIDLTNGDWKVYTSGALPVDTTAIFVHIVDPVPSLRQGGMQQSVKLTVQADNNQSGDVYVNTVGANSAMNSKVDSNVSKVSTVQNDISGVAFWDPAYAGISTQASSQYAYPNVPVSLYRLVEGERQLVTKNSKGVDLTEVVTNQEGAYLFSDVVDGEYQVGFNLGELNSRNEYITLLPEAEDPYGRPTNRVDPSTEKAPIYYTKSFKISIETATSALNLVKNKSVGITKAPKLEVVKKVLNSNGQDINNQVVKVGDTITYTIDIANLEGKSIVKKAQLSDTLPEGIEFVPGSLTMNTYKISDSYFENQTLNFPLGNIPGVNTGQPMYKFKFQAVITKKASGKLTNIAKVEGFSVHVTEKDHKESAVDNDAQPIPKVTKVVTKDGKPVTSLVLGNRYEYTITLENLKGAGIWKNITLEDNLPTEVSYVPNSTSVDGQKMEDAAIWSKDNEGYLSGMSYSLSELAEQEKKVITFSVKLKNLTNTLEVVNIAKATGSNKDGKNYSAEGKNSTQLSYNLIHIRQVILYPMDYYLVVPTKGYYHLLNKQSKESQLEPSQSVSTVSRSGVLKPTVTKSDFDSYYIRQFEGDTGIQIQVTIPEYYQYYGNTQSFNGNSLTIDHDPSRRIQLKESPYLDLRSTKEVWVTVYLMPKTGRIMAPSPYSWDANQNNFGVLP